MRLRFLGTGTSTGIPEIACRCEVCTSSDTKDKRLRASVVVELNNQVLLIDCGPDFRLQAIQSDMTRVDAVLLTHSHYDHCGGIDDLRPFCRHNSVPIYAEKDVLFDVKTRLPYCFNERKYPGIPDLELKKVDLIPFRIGNVLVEPIRAMHYKLPVLGYRIENMAYITDALYLPDEEYEKLEGLDVLVINALRHKPHLSHQTLEDALRSIERIHPRKAYLTHLSHDMGTHRQTSLILPENVEIAYDGLMLNI